MSKTYRINLRLDKTELEQIKAKAGAQPLAQWCREIALAKQGGGNRVAPRTDYRLADPALLREINAIGRNLNQIARLGHAARKNHSLELLQLVQGLERIHTDLEELLSHARQNHQKSH